MAKISFIVWTISTVVHLVFYLISLQQADKWLVIRELGWLGISLIMCRLEWLTMMGGW